MPDRAYLTSGLVRDRAPDLAIFCKAWRMRNAAGRYAKDQFSMDFAAGQLTCPVGVTMAFEPGTTVRFPKHACAPARCGVIGAFPLATRRELFTELQPLVTGFDDHPWNWVRPEPGVRNPREAEHSRWNAGKDLAFVPLRPERVVEVRYDHMEGTRFRHTAQFVRWRADRDPRSCGFDQLEEPVRFNLADILTG